jgi:hypothetical protein
VSALRDIHILIQFIVSTHIVYYIVLYKLYSIERRLVLSLYIYGQPQCGQSSHSQLAHLAAETTSAAAPPHLPPENAASGHPLPVRYVIHMSYIYTAGISQGA